VARSLPEDADTRAIAPLRETISAVEAREIERALEHSGGNKAEASRLLGISYPNLLKKVRLYGLDRSG
jgi:DNA-binding NtrC family response regulator